MELNAQNLNAFLEWLEEKRKVVLAEDHVCDYGCTERDEDGSGCKYGWAGLQQSFYDVSESDIKDFFKYISKKEGKNK